MNEGILEYNPFTSATNTGVRNDDLRLLSVNEARKILGIRANALKNLIVQGRIKAIEINGKYKLTIMSIRDFVTNVNSNHQNKPAISNKDEKSIINEILNKHI